MIAQLTPMLAPFCIGLALGILIGCALMAHP